MQQIGYLIFIVCFLLLPLLLFRNYVGIVYPILIMFFFILAFWTFIVYIAKGFGHLYFILKYFSYSPALIRNLILLPVSRTAVLRMLNFSSLGFIAANIMFILEFPASVSKKLKNTLKILAGSLFILEFILYDPSIYIFLYTFLYPSYATSRAILSFYDIFQIFTLIFNNVCLIVCIVLFVYFFLLSPKIRSVRHTMFFLCISYGSLITTYILIMFWSPTLLVRYSKIANLITYVPLSLSLKESFYFMFPYILLILSIFFAYNFLRYYTIRRKMTSSSLEILHTVQGATVSSRLFCHYIKNELLSLDALLDEIPITPENSGIMKKIAAQYEELYAHIDGIHEDLKNNSMKLQAVPIEIPISNALENMKAWKDAENIRCSVIYPEKIPEVIIDKTDFTHALVNIIRNAVEAMLSTDKPVHRLLISVTEIKKYVIIKVTDNGTGIPQKNLINIFTPLFSTKPQTRNWGMGLSLAYNIITASGGQISVTSKEGKGCTFEIQLVNARTV